MVLLTKYLSPYPIEEISSKFGGFSSPSLIGMEELLPLSPDELSTELLIQYQKAKEKAIKPKAKNTDLYLPQRWSILSNVIEVSSHIFPGSKSEGERYSISVSKISFSR
jgi:hypothetical protein